MHKLVISGVALAVALVWGAPAGAVNYTIPAKVFLYKPGKKILLISKATFVIPDPNDNPTVEGGAVKFSTDADPNGETFTLAPSDWSTLGPPSAPKGYKAKSVDCKRVQVKNNIVKAICRAPDLGALPIDPNNEISTVITVGTGTTRYCALCGGQPKGNPAKLAKRKDCAAPSACPASPSGAFLDLDPL